MAENRSIDRRPTDEVFSHLAHDVRVAILEAMLELRGEKPTFSDLYDRVDVDDSGQFNYHLEKLTGTFLRRVDGQYELTHAGKKVVGAILAGTYTADVTQDSTPVDERCPTCGRSLRLRYDHGHAVFECSACEYESGKYYFPPGSVEQFDPGELPAAVFRWRRHFLKGVFAGFCQTCAGRMRGTLVRGERPDRPAEFPIHGQFECSRCGEFGTAKVTTIARYHPGVEGFFVDHGFDPTRVPWIRIRERLLERSVAVNEEKPVQATVSFALAKEVVEAVIDADASVSSVERRPSSP